MKILTKFCSTKGLGYDIVGSLTAARVSLSTVDERRALRRGIE